MRQPPATVVYWRALRRPSYYSGARNLDHPSSNGPNVETVCKLEEVTVLSRANVVCFVELVIHGHPIQTNQLRNKVGINCYIQARIGSMREVSTMNHLLVVSLVARERLLSTNQDLQLLHALGTLSPSAVLDFCQDGAQRPIWHDDPLPRSDDNSEYHSR